MPKGLNFASIFSVGNSAQTGVEEVLEYCRGDRPASNAKPFIDYYTSNGWKVGRNPMKDWQASFRNWCSRQGEFSNGNGRPQPKTNAEYLAEAYRLAEEREHED